jgi:hypothetical protein
MLATKGPIAIIALVYWSVSWGIEVLVEGLLTAERPVALIALENWSEVIAKLLGYLSLTYSTVVLNYRRFVNPESYLFYIKIYIIILIERSLLRKRI